MNFKLIPSILVFFFFLISGGLAADQSPTLRGRWRADTVPTGYWIIDRFADGRYAQKEFLIHDYSKPSEIVVIWGRWKLKAKKYISIIDGSTSPFVQKFAGKWKSTEIASLDTHRFVFMSSDGHARTEEPFNDTTRLVELPMTMPPGLRGPNLTIIMPQLKSVPEWVRSPKSP